MKKDFARLSISKALELREKGMVSLVGAGGKTSLLYALARELAMEGRKVLVTTTTHMLAPSPQEASTSILSPDPQEILEELRSLPQRWGPIFVASRREGQEGKMVGLSPEGVERLWGEGLLDWILVEADGAARRPLKAPARHEPLVPGSSLWVVGLVGLDAVGKPLDEAWVFRWEIYGRLLGLSPGEKITPESVAGVALHPEGLFKAAPSRATKILWLNKADLPGVRSEAYRILSCIEEKGWGDIGRVIIGSALSREPVESCFSP